MLPTGAPVRPGRRPRETTSAPVSEALELLEGLGEFRKLWWDRYLEGRKHSSANPLSPADRATLAALGYADG